MDNSDISVVVQGPVHVDSQREFEGGITKTCLESVRQFLPGSKIILSTWPDSCLDGLDYDEVVVSDDPGQNVFAYYPDKSPRLENTNRQIVSTKEGLKLVDTKYAMKLRTDFKLTGDRFKHLQETYDAYSDKFRVLDERVVVSNNFSRKYYRGLPTAFYICDFFYFGLTKDVKGIWDIPLFPDLPYRQDQEGCYQHLGAPWPILDVNQMLVKSFLLNNFSVDIRIEHKYDLRFGALEQSRQCFANNFIVASPKLIDVFLPRKWISGRQAKWGTQVTYFSFGEWERLYRHYCDREYKPVTPTIEIVVLWLSRMVFVPMKFLGNTHKILIARWRFMKAKRANENPN